jgi:hypothetical protein
LCLAERSNNVALTLNQLHCRSNFTLKPNQITAFSHNQEGIKGLTAARIGPNHTAHFVTHRPSRSSRLDFDELAFEETLPTNTSVKRTIARLSAKSASVCLPIQIHHGDLVHSTTSQIKPPIRSCDHIANHAAAGWDRLRTEALRLRIKLHQGIGFHA